MIRKHNPTPATGAAIGIEAMERCDQSIIAAIDAYFAHFATPVVEEVRGKKREVCLNCGEPFDSMGEVFGMGVAMRWGMVHGEANCTGCGWPARAHHRISDGEGGAICTLSNRFLQYHPDQVMTHEGEAV